MARGNLLATVGTVGLMALSAIASAQSPAAPTTAREDPAPSSWRSRPAWSPDGTRFITASMRGGQVDLWVTQADTSARRGGRTTAPSRPAGMVAEWPVRRIRDDAERPLRIDVKCADAPAWRLIPDARAPQWSPDGKRILCIAQRTATSSFDLSGRERRERDPALPWLSSELLFAAAAGWRPDGAHLAIVGLDRNHTLGLWCCRSTLARRLESPRSIRRGVEGR